MIQGFKDFLLRGNVIDLAVAVVIGAAFSNIVNALVSSIITPLIGAIGGNPDFSGLKFTLNGSDFLIGNFINALIAFLIIAAVIYFLVVTPMNKLMERMKKGQSVDADTKICPECMEAIPAQAKRCKFCTSAV
jgi:large conductance mechanosensitive channel